MANIPNKSDTPTNGGENYSVDEMMARLKKGERQKRRSSPEPSPEEQAQGELVTREDGTQAIKVRRRKRRSKQPPKQSTPQTNPRLKWTLLGSAVGVGVLLVVGTVFIIAKYNGRKFKSKTESNITELSGAMETTLTQLRVTPVSAKANKTEILWGPHAFLKDATFGNIRASIKATSFFSSNWIGEEIVASTGSVRLQTPLASTELNTTAIPSPYQFGAYRCNQLDLLFGTERNAPAIHDLQVSLRQLENEKHQIVFHNGTMKVDNWPEMKLSSGIVTINSQSADIEALLEARDSHNGELTIKGNIKKSIATPATLNVRAKNYPIQEILGPDMGRLLQGEIQSDSGSFSYDYQKPIDKSLSFILPFNSTELKLEGLPMLKDLNKLIGDTAYVRPSLYRCQGTIMRTSDGLSLTDLKLPNNNLLTIDGNIYVDAKGQLSGKLSVGVPQSTFDEDVPAPFTGPTSGFYHAEVTLSGTVRTPSDNLHSQLMAGRKNSPRRAKLRIEDILPPTDVTPPADPTTPAKPTAKDFEEFTR